MPASSTSRVDVPEWLRSHYELVDAARLDEYLEDFTDDAELQFGADPPLRGKEALRERFAAGHARHALRHTFRNVWEAGETTIVEFDAVYTYPDGEVVSTAAVVIVERRNDLIRELRVFMDQRPFRR
jgi:ketosteroid isomerase-like protein